MGQKTWHSTTPVSLRLYLLTNFHNSFHWQFVRDGKHPVFVVTAVELFVIKHVNNLSNNLESQSPASATFTFTFQTFANTTNALVCFPPEGWQRHEACFWSFIYGGCCQRIRKIIFRKSSKKYCFVHEDFLHELPLRVDRSVAVSFKCSPRRCIQFARKFPSKAFIFRFHNERAQLLTADALSSDHWTRRRERDKIQLLKLALLSGRRCRFSVSLPHNVKRFSNSTTFNRKVQGNNLLKLVVPRSRM